MSPSRPDLANLRRGVLAALAVFATLPGCQTFGASPQPARLLAPSQACLDELRQFAEEATGRQVTITTASFAQSDELLLERAMHRGADGRPLDGRSMDRPELLRLLRRNDACIVIHPKSEIKRALNRCQCEEITR